MLGVYIVHMPTTVCNILFLFFKQIWLGSNEIRDTRGQREQNGPTDIQNDTFFFTSLISLTPRKK